VLYNVGNIIQIPEADLSQSATAYHIRIDVKDSGIRVVPGSHVGILYESSAEEVHKTLLAFADGDANKAKVSGMDDSSHPIL
jgi:sulfite reductase alpha subunit-like flavoprotein